MTPPQNPNRQQQSNEARPESMTKKELAKSQKRSLELLNAWLDLTPEERREIDEAGMVHTKTEVLGGKPVKCYREK